MKNKKKRLSGGPPPLVLLGVSVQSGGEGSWIGPDDPSVLLASKDETHGIAFASVALGPPSPMPEVWMTVARSSTFQKVRKV